MQDLINREFTYTIIRNWTDEDKGKHSQIDVYRCKVTFADTSRIEYEALERTECLDKAPFDTGGITKGGLAMFGIVTASAKGNFAWL